MPQIVSSAIANAPPPDGLVSALHLLGRAGFTNAKTRNKMCKLFDLDGRHRLLNRRNWCEVWELDAAGGAPAGLGPVQPGQAPAPGALVFSLRVETFDAKKGQQDASRAVVREYHTVAPPLERPPMSAAARHGHHGVAHSQVGRCVVWCGVVWCGVAWCWLWLCCFFGCCCCVCRGVVSTRNQPTTTQSQTQSPSHRHNTAITPITTNDRTSTARTPGPSATSATAPTAPTPTTTSATCTSCTCTPRARRSRRAPAPPPALLAPPRRRAAARRRRGSSRTAAAAAAATARSSSGRRRRPRRCRASRRRRRASSSSGDPALCPFVFPFVFAFFLQHRAQPMQAARHNTALLLSLSLSLFLL